MKIGILFPLSNVYPSVGFDFLDGLNSLLKVNGHVENVTIIKEAVGFGGEEKDNYQKAQKLLISDDVDVLIAYLDEKVVSILYPLAQATGKLMIVVNPGANYPANWIAQPTVIRLNLQHAFLCALTGRLAAKSANGQAALATTYYDCGYLHSAAMVNHFLKATGEIKFNYINNQPYNESFEINKLVNFLSSDPACSNLLCVFDKLPASLFLNLLDTYKAKDSLHLFISPMMIQQLLEDNKKTFPFSSEGYLSWYPGIENEANEDLKKSCKKAASIFSLLGWETGMIINEILKYSNDDLTNGELMTSHLKNQPLDSPRGRMKLDYETQCYIAPVSKFYLEAGGIKPVITSNINIDDEWKSFTAVSIEGPVTGWTNTYLCY